MFYIRNVLCAVFLFGAMVQDIRTKKIPNSWNLMGTAAGVLCAFFDRQYGVGDMLLGFCAACFIGGFLGWGLGLFRAGDAKVLMALGALKGFRPFVNIFLLAVLAGGVCAVGILIIKKDFKRRFNRLRLYAKNMILTRSYIRYTPEKKDEFPFTIAIAIGGILDLFVSVI